MAKRKPIATTSAAAPSAPERVSYCRTFPGHFPGVSEWIEAVVEPYDGGWAANCSLGFPDPDKLRDQWNTWRLYADRDAAARYAADFVLTAEAIVSALERGERPFMPHRAMAEACDMAMLADARLVALSASVNAAVDARSRSERRDTFDRARRDAVNAFYRAHDFREFRSAGDAEKAARAA